MKKITKKLKKDLCHCIGSFKNGAIKLSGDQRSIVNKFLVDDLEILESHIVNKGT